MPMVIRKSNDEALGVYRGAKSLDTASPKVVFQPYGDSKTLEIDARKVYLMGDDLYAAHLAKQEKSDWQARAQAAEADAARFQAALVTVLDWVKDVDPWVDAWDVCHNAAMHIEDALEGSEDD